MVSQGGGFREEGNVHCNFLAQLCLQGKRRKEVYGTHVSTNPNRPDHNHRENPLRARKKKKQMIVFEVSNTCMVDEF